MKYGIVTGNFDGVHLGHESLFKHLIKRCGEEGLTPLVISFNPHTRAFIQKQSIPLLTLKEEKAIILKEKYGLDLVLLEFDETLKNLSHEEYAKKILVDKIGAQLWIRGLNHHYGKKAAEKKIHENYDFIKTEDLNLCEIKDEIISSSLIRDLLLKGQIEKANSLLGYDYFIEGQVIRGDQRGSEIGFPTANLELKSQEKLIPLDGVYGGYVDFKGQRLKAVANLGQRPSFDRVQSRRIEVHLLGKFSSLYGEVLRFNCLKFIRASQPFSDLESLKVQIKSDVSYWSKQKL